MALERLLLAHRQQFDTQRDFEFAERRFAGYAAFHSQASRYVLVKRAKLWGYHMHEHIFFHTTEHLTRQELDELTTFMRADALTLVKPDSEHMTTYLSLVVLADSIDEDAAKTLRRTRMRKNFRGGLQGWADLRLAAVDLGIQSIVTNGQGRRLRKTLAANCFM